jgi:hypothetical protein
MTGRSRLDARQRQQILRGRKALSRRDADHSPHLVPRSSMSRSYTSSPLRLHRCVVGLFYPFSVFIIISKWNSNFLVYYSIRFRQINDFMLRYNCFANTILLSQSQILISFSELFRRLQSNLILSHIPRTLYLVIITSTAKWHVLSTCACA